MKHPNKIWGLGKNYTFESEVPQAKHPKEMNAGPMCTPSPAFPGFVHGSESPWSNVLAWTAI